MKQKECKAIIILAIIGLFLQYEIAHGSTGHYWDEGPGLRQVEWEGTAVYDWDPLTEFIGVIGHPDGLLTKGLWGTSETDLFVAADYKLIHYQDNKWVTVPGITVYDFCSLTEICGSSASDIYAAGSTGLYHFDGTQWNQMPLPTFEDPIDDLFPLFDLDYVLWQSGISDIFLTHAYIINSKNRIHSWIFHWNGTGWTTATIQGAVITDGWGKSGLDAYAVGYTVTEWAEGPKEAVIFQYDGSSWSVIKRFPGTPRLNGIWGSSSNDLYAVGSNGLIIHYNGIEWQTIQSDPNVEFSCIWGTSASHVIVGGKKTDPTTGKETAALLHFNGESWRALPYPATVPIRDIWGPSEQVFFGVGEEKTIFRYIMGSQVGAHPDQSEGLKLLATNRQQKGRDEILQTHSIPNNFTPLTDVLDITATISNSGECAAFRFMIENTEGAVDSFSLRKLKDDGTSITFGPYAALPDTQTDGTWWITDDDGHFIDIDGNLSENMKYYINFVVRDNGEYDLNGSNNTIRDPLVLGSTSQTSKTGATTSAGGGGCFIATASFGSFDAPSVRILRKFRDLYLLTNDWGREFVRLYYEWSPYFSEIIEKRKSFRTVVRVSLLPLVGFGWMALKFGLTTSLIVALFVSGLCVVTGYYGTRTVSTMTKFGQSHDPKG